MEANASGSDRSAAPSSPSAFRIGCAGWAVRSDHKHLFGDSGTHLQRYAATFSAVEINSSFYRPHQKKTYERWAASVPAGFRFSVKLPKLITHEHRLSDYAAPLTRFLDEISGLGSALGPVLVQFPASFEFEDHVALPFFTDLRTRFAGDVVCEPRHASWFTPEVDRRLTDLRIARVAADPACVPSAAAPGAWTRLAYYRLHGSPIIYRSRYGSERVAELAFELDRARARTRELWCIFDNTAEGAAQVDALDLAGRLR